MTGGREGAAEAGRRPEHLGYPMRRRPKVQLDATGAALVLPLNLAVFTPEDWSGVSDYDRWSNWWQARNRWALETMHRMKFWTAPQMTAEDISRLI